MSMNPGSQRCEHWTVLNGACTYCGTPEELMDGRAEALRLYEIYSKAWRLEKERTGETPKIELVPLGRALGLEQPDLDQVRGMVDTWLDQRRRTRVTAKAVWKNANQKV